MPPIVEVRDLAVAFPGPAGGLRRVVDGVSLEIEAGEAMGLVGESGCGKSLTALALIRLVPEPGRIAGGIVRVAGTDVAAADERRMGELRGAVVGFVFQEPAQALNPVRSVASQVSESARIHRGRRAGDSRSLAVGLLAEVGLEDPERLARAYPHQLSGGQRQRVLLAAALAADPALLVADEPTSALDSVAQRAFVELVRELRARRGLTLLFVSHDLALVGQLAERVTVLYAGETVEVGQRGELLGAPLHPYTRALLAARAAGGSGGRFPAIPGSVPREAERGRGCRFAPRCPVAFDRCRAARPALAEVGGGRRVRCFLASPAEEPGG